MPPINDDWANATAISGSSGSVTGSNVGATTEAGEPAPYSGSGTATVWWAWTAPNSDQVTFDTFGSKVGTDTFDTVLDVWTGGSLAALTMVVANDDAPVDPNGVNPVTGGWGSQVNFTPSSGTTYYLRINGYDTSQEGSIDLNWYPTPAPPVPTITGISPTHGRIGTTVHVAGHTLTDISAADVNGLTASFTFVSDFEILVYVPAGATSGPITLTVDTYTPSSGTFTVDPPGVDTDEPTNPPPGVLIAARGGGLISTGSATVGGVSADNVVVADQRVLVETPNSPGASGPVVLSTGAYGDLTGPDVTIGPLGRPAGRARLFVDYGSGGSGTGTEFLWEVGAGEYDVSSLSSDIRFLISTFNRMTASLDRSFLVWNNAAVPHYGGSWDVVAKRVDTDGTAGPTYDPSAGSPFGGQRSAAGAVDTNSGVLMTSYFTGGPSPTADDLRPWVTLFDRDTGSILSNYVDPSQYDFLLGALAATPAGDAYGVVWESGSPADVYRIDPSSAGVVVNSIADDAAWFPAQIVKYHNRVAVIRVNSDSTSADVWDVPVDGSTPRRLFQVDIAGDVVNYGGTSTQSFQAFDHDDGDRFWLCSSNGTLSFVWSVTDGGIGADDPLLYFGHDLDAIAAIGGGPRGWLIGSVGY